MGTRRPDGTGYSGAPTQPEQIAPTSTAAIAASGPAAPRGQGLGSLTLRVAIAALVLNALGIVLTLPGEVGLDAFLGASASTAASQLHAMHDAWARLTVFACCKQWKVTLNDVAMLDLFLDTAFFIPLYGAWLFEIARRLAGVPKGAPRLRAGVSFGVALVTSALMATDLLENTSGLVKIGLLGESTWHVVLAALLAPAVGFWFWRSKTSGESILESFGHFDPPARFVRRFWRISLTVAASFAALVVIAFISQSLREPLLVFSLRTHQAKQALLAILFTAFGAMAVNWIFASSHATEDRGAVRRGVADILFRTRYVIIALAALIGLTLGLDQCRDVAIGVADGLATWQGGWLAVLVMLLSGVAVWAMSFSCWLWARLVCRMPGPGAAAVELSAPTRQTLQLVARATARVLGLVPPFVTALVSVYATRDAMWAGTERGGNVLTPAWLLAFGAFSVLGAIAFVVGRERAAGRTGSDMYYNDPNLDQNWMATVAEEKYRFIWSHGPGPLALPALALAFALALRSLAVLAAPSVPLAFAVIVFSLVAWVGFFGWLSLKEQREARPWALLIIAIVGVEGSLGATNNHLVRLVASGHQPQLAAAGLQVLGSWLLALCVIAAAGLIVSNKRPRHPALGWPLILAGAAVMMLVVTLFIDRVPRPRPGANHPLDRPTIETAFEGWSNALRALEPGDREPHRVYLVASEGGGARAAYWTARTLAELAEHIDDFDRHTLMMSGVSGGALGEAAYIGCARHVLAGPPSSQTGQSPLAACVDQFGSTDLLTPMVGAWLFEDAIARVLPTRTCATPGCGFLSRGLWFEQALERGVQEFAEGINHIVNDDGRVTLPHLFLNSTWVESGDRAIAASVHADWKSGFANVRDQIDFVQTSGSEPADMPLSAAAHNASRFPFVNAIGVLNGPPGAQSSGHLADGGYFDNSGAHTVLDVLAAFRRWIDGRPCQNVAPNACEEKLAWLNSLKPTVLVVQNGISVDCSRDAGDVGDRAQHDEARVACLREQWQLEALGNDIRSSAPLTEDYQPEKPRDANSWRLYVDALGPLITVVNVAGTGANGRRAEALLKRGVDRFPLCADEKNQPGCVVRLAQRADGILYPLGWYLSPTARLALDRKAKREVDVARRLLAGGA